MHLIRSSIPSKVRADSIADVRFPCNRTHLVAFLHISNKLFIEVLHEVRKGDVSAESEKFLRKCERELPPTCNGIIPTRLYSRNVDVARENNAELAKLPGPSTHYSSADYIIEEGSETPVMRNDHNTPLSEKQKVLCNNDFWKHCQGQNEIQLKAGAQVMLLQNISVGRGDKSLANGSRGKVVEITHSPPESMQKFPVKPPEGVPGDPYAIVDFLNGERVAIGPSNFVCELSGIGVCVRRTIPLKLAWSISIHKSQGMTLDYVKVDLKGVS